MDKLEKQFENLNNIVKKIESNNILKKTKQSNNLENIFQLNEDNKINLNNKLNTIEKFTDLLDNLIINKPTPNTLNINLIKYTNYNNYYNN